MSSILTHGSKQPENPVKYLTNSITAMETTINNQVQQQLTELDIVPYHDVYYYEIDNVGYKLFTVKHPTNKRKNVTAIAVTRPINYNDKYTIRYYGVLYPIYLPFP